MVKIVIDYGRCRGGKACGDCIYICPQGVFMNAPQGKPSVTIPPAAYKVTPYFEMLCDRCLACVKVCRVGAVHIE